MRSRQNAFTLIELLVVISIISLLIAVLLPALQSARKSAQRIKSLSQIRQIGFAKQTYANDHKGYLPFNRARSASQVASNSYSSPQGAYWGGTLYHMNYLPSKQVYFSPGHDRSPSMTLYSVLFTNKEWFEWRMIDYGSNYLGAMSDEVAATSKTFRIGEALPPASNHLLVVESVRAGDFGLPSGHGFFSFQGAVNRFYMDGHGTSVKGNDLGWDGVDAFVGQLIPNPKFPYTARTAAPWYRMGFPDWW